MVLIYTNLGLPEDALEQFKEQERICIQMENNKQLPKVYHIICDVFTDLGDLQQALKYAEKFHSKAHELGLLDESQRATTTLGRIYYMMGLEMSSKKREFYFQKSLDYYNLSQNLVDTLNAMLPKNEITEMRACLYLNIAVLLEEMNQLETATEKYQACATLSQSCASKDTELKALIALSKIKIVKGEFEEALNFSDEALRVAKKIKNNSDITTVDILVAKIKLCQAEFETAAKLLKKSFQNIDMVENNTSESFNNLARLALQGMISVRILSTCKTDKIKIMLLHKIGLILFMLKSFKLALKYFKEELQLIQKCNYDECETIGPLRYIAESYYFLMNYAEAHTHFENLFKIQSDKNLIGFRIYLHFSHCLEKLGLPFKLIESVLKQASDYAQKVGSIQQQKIISKKLHDLYIRNNKKSQFDEIQLVSDDDISSEDSSYSTSLISDIDIENEFEKLDDCTPILVSQSTTAPKPKKAITFIPNRKNELGETLIHVASIKGNTERVKELIENGADIHLRDNCGWLPLHEACNHGHIDIVKILLDHGSFINDRGGIKCNGITPLMDACQNFHFDIAELLLENGADPSIPDNDGRTVLDVLRENVDNVEPDMRDTFYKIIDMIKTNYSSSKKFPCAKTEIESYVETNNPRLDALANDRVPLILAAEVDSQSTNNFNDLESSPFRKSIKRSQIKQCEGGNQSKRRRIRICSSDDDTYPDHSINLLSNVPGNETKLLKDISFAMDLDVKFDAISTPLIALNQTINTNTSIESFDFTILSKDFGTEIYTINYNETKIVLFLLNLISQKNKLTFLDIILTQGIDIIFPFNDIRDIFDKCSTLECYKVSSLEIQAIYTELCSFVKLNPSKLHLTLLSNNISSLYRYNIIHQLTRLHQILLYSFMIRQVSVFDISYLSISKSDDFSFICHSLNYFDRLESIILSNSQLYCQKLLLLLNSCKNTERIRYFDLSYNDLSGSSSELAQIFYNFISKCPNLETIYLSNTNLPDIFDPSLVLCSVIQEHRCLNSFDFSGNDFSDQTLNNLFTSFLPWNDFNILRLSDIGDGSNLVQYLVNLLFMSKKSVKSLDISNNNISGQICLLFSSSILHSLIDLDISSASLDSEFISLFKFEASQISSLKVLNLSNNPGLFQNIYELSDFITTAMSIYHLSFLNLSNTLSTNEYSDVSPVIYQSQIKKESNLSTIVLNNNQFTLESINFFIENFGFHMYKVVIDEFVCRLELISNVYIL